MQSEAALRAASVACFVNAQELYEEAKLLYDRVRGLRSVVLALIGAEEFAKSVVFTVAALLPAQRALLPAKLSGHALKHHICVIADGVVCACSEGWAAEGTTPISRLGDLFRALAEIGLARLLDGKKTMQYYEELQREHAEESRRWRHLRAEPEKDIYLGSGEADLKNAALYVDLDASGKVLSPMNRVEATHAVQSILALESYLEAYATLPTVVGDDQRWCDFAERVRHRLPDTP